MIKTAMRNVVLEEELLLVKVWLFVWILFVGEGFYFG
jgi:hypothetical protein